MEHVNTPEYTNIVILDKHSVFLPIEIYIEASYCPVSLLLNLTTKI